MSSNIDDLKSLHCDCAFVYLKYIWNACINIFMQMKEINIDGEEEKKMGKKQKIYYYKMDIMCVCLSLLPRGWDQPFLGITEVQFEKS